MKFKCPRCQDRYDSQSKENKNKLSAMSGCGLCEGKGIPTNIMINRYIFEKMDRSIFDWGDIACSIRDSEKRKNNESS